MTPDACTLSVVIPAYNEESRIGESLEKIVSHLKERKFDYELIVVDDGSQDRTLRVIRTHLDASIPATVLSNDVNRGKGYTVKKGMMAAKGRYILFTDTDLSTPIEEVEKLLDALRSGHDVAIGSRALAFSKVVIHQRWYREYGGRLFNKLVQLLTLPGIKDTQCGFKCFTREAARKIFPNQTLDRWSFDVEILYIAKRSGLSIIEVPVIWYNSFDSRVSFLGDGLRMAMDICKIRYVHRKSKFSD